MQQRDDACYDEAVRAWEASDRLDMLRAEAAFSIQVLPAHLLDGPATDAQELGQFPLAHPLDRSTRMYSRCCSVRLGRRPGEANVVMQRGPGTSIVTAVPLLHSPVCRFPLLLLHRSKGTLLVLDG